MGSIRVPAQNCDDSALNWSKKRTPSPEGASQAAKPVLMGVVDPKSAYTCPHCGALTLRGAPLKVAMTLYDHDSAMTTAQMAEFSGVSKRMIQIIIRDYAWLFDVKKSPQRIVPHLYSLVPDARATLEGMVEKDKTYSDEEFA